MIYLGHFTFIEHDEEGFNHGLFSAVVEADDIDNATVRFHSLLDQKKRGSDLFDKRTFIFLEDIIEIKQVPVDGFIAHHSLYEGEPPPFVSKSIPGISEDECEAYRPYPEFEGGDISDELDIVPFITIDR